MQRIEADHIASVEDLRSTPAVVLQTAQDTPVAILSHDRVVAYMIAPELYEVFAEWMNDRDLRRLIEERADERPVAVALDEL